jgi:CDP-6-deoxy-D-xylo-4-hexulose-3-dehydrase
MREAIETLLDSIDADQYLKYAYNQKCETPVYYSGPVWDKEELIAAISSLVGGLWLASGEQVSKFENRFSKDIGLAHSLMVNSGSSANLVLLAAAKTYYDWDDDAEIIVSVVGFPTTIAPIVQNNLKVKFVDIEMDSLNFDLSDVEDAINDKTKAVFLSPVLGNPVDMDKLTDLCRSKGIRLLLDGCDSLGTEWKGKPLYEYSDAATCSFYPAHHITTGEGGMVSSNDAEFIKIARSIAWWGRACYCVGSCNLLKNGVCGKRFFKWLDNYDGVVDHKYVFTNMGYNLKPLDLQGAIGLVQLDKAPTLHKKRRENKARIEKLLHKYIKGIHIPDELSDASTSWFGVPVVCETKELKHKLVPFFESNSIQTRNYFAGNILLHPAYEHLDDYNKYPNANQVLDKVFFLGTSPSYKEGTFRYIEDVLETWQNLE